jgi:hypothetical protein
MRQRTAPIGETGHGEVVMLPIIQSGALDDPDLDDGIEGGQP